MLALAAWIIAAALAAAALVLTAWGIFGDRARGRRRCPRCFYPAAEGARRCPECGHEAANERALLRTRRRWRLVGLGAVLLTLSAAAAGTALVRQHGAWGWAPGPVLTRLLWLGEEGVDAEILARVRRGAVTREDARRIAVSAASMLRRRDPTEVDRGLTLLEALARNSFVLVSDPAGTPRPMLEELRPEQALGGLFALLDAQEAEARRRAVALLSHYRNVDARAVVELVVRSSAEESVERDTARTALSRNWRAGDSVKRLPGLPSFVLYALIGQPRYQDVSLEDVEEAFLRFSREVAARAHDAPQLLQYALACAEAAEDRTTRVMGVWLHGHLSGFDDRSRGIALELCGHEDQLMRSSGIEMLSGYTFGEDIRSALDHALRTEPHESTAISAALRTAAEFGREARPLAPAFLEIARRHGGDGGSGFVEQYLAIGGDRREMLDALLTWLEANESHAFFMHFGYLVDLELHDEAAAARVRRLLSDRPPVWRQHQGPYDTIAHVALATAALGGDRTWATQTILDGLEQPPKTTGYIAGSTDHALVTLCRRDLADPVLLADRYLADPAAQLDCLTLLGWMDAAARPVADRIAPLRDHPDPQVAAAAAKALERVR